MLFLKKSKDVKILVLVFHFPPMSGGGVVVITEIINKFVELGNEVTVITPDIEWNGEKYEPEINTKIKIIRSKTPSRTNIKIAARRCQSEIKNIAIKLAKNEKFDFIFSIFHPFHLVPKAAVEVSKELQIPSIIKVDDAIFQKANGIKSIQRKVEKIINTKTLKNSDYILVSNQETSKVIEEEYRIKSENISIIPNGVDLSLFKKSKIINKNKIVFTGAMYYHRGLDVLLDSIPLIVEHSKDVKFVLIGSGTELENLKKIVLEKNIEKFVEFTGWMDRKKIPENIEDALIGIGPLRLTEVTKGALPIKVLEYMATSLPIIAQKGTLPKDILEDGENGFFINSSEELAEKINLLLNDKKLCFMMGEKSFKMVQKFSWNTVVKNILKIAEKN